MASSQWFPVMLAGADGAPAPVKCATQDDGEWLHAWAKFTMGGKPYVVHARVSIAECEAEVLDRLPAQSVSAGAVADDEGVDYLWVNEEDDDDGPSAVADGQVYATSEGRRSRRRRRKSRRKRRRRRLKRFGKRFARGIKTAAKKVGKLKVVRKVVGTVKKVLNNPLVKAAMMAVPGGAAITMARTAARLATRGAKGIKGARRAVRRISRSAGDGCPASQEAMRLMAAGIALDMPEVGRVLLAGKTESEQWDAIAGWDESEPGAVSGYDLVPWSAAGDARGELARELEALNEFASAGAWDGVRWMARQLAWRKMSDPNLYGRRQAVLDGRAVMAARFA